MKTNLKKLFSALVLLGMTTGCGNLGGTSSSSTANTSTGGTIISSSLSENNSGTTSSNTHSSTGNQNSSTSSSNSSSNNNGGAGDLVGSPVSEAEWNAALSKDALSNVTYDMEAAMYQTDSSMDFIKAGYVIDMTSKVTREKMEIIGYENRAAVLEKEGFIDYLQEALGQPVTEAELEQYIGMMLGDGEVTIEGDLINYVESSDLMKEYGEYESEETHFEYDFDDDYNKYIKTREFGDLSDFNYYMDTFVNLDAYSNATFDETRGAYKFDGKLLISEEDLMEGMEYDIDAYYYFVNKKLAKIEVNAFAEYQGQTQDTSYTLSFYDYGTTSVTLPTSADIHVCDHREYVWTDQYNDDYHYVQCGSCYSVLEYEKHSEGVCDECGYYPTTEKNITIPGLDGSIIIEARYNGITNELESLDIHRTNGSMSYSSKYDEETGMEIRTYRPGGCSDYIVETIKRENTSACVEKETHTYNFYNENNEPYCDPIVTIKYSESHNFDRNETVSPTDPCKVITTMTCQDCGHTEQDYYFNHRYGEWVNGEKDENCKVTSTRTCEDCNHKNYEHREEHNGTLVIYSEEGSYGTGHFSCPDCGADTDGTFYYNGWNDSYHYYTFAGLDGEKYSGTQSHSHNEEGYCGCGHWRSTEEDHPEK